ncbi:MAG TPA: hypothetical protein VNE00_17600 [Paraburkholderia sp.]|nr:hypothetical protein [Paraburkholderia sp.]
MTSIHRPGGASAPEAAAQTSHAAETGAAQHTRARFATKTRNNVRFAHARLEHQKSEARSADARRLSKALTRPRKGKAGTTRFAAGKQGHSGQPRSAGGARNNSQRVTRDGGNGGGRNGGGQHSQDSTHDKGGTARIGPSGSARASRVNTPAAPLFAGDLHTLDASARRTALASAWCDTLTGPAMAQHSSASLHDAMQQLRTLRQQEGALPLDTLGQVRAALMEASERNGGNGAAPPAAGSAAPTNALPGQRAQDGAAAPLTVSATRNLLAPLLALSAAAPMSAARDGRAAFVNSLLGERAADFQHGVAGA